MNILKVKICPSCGHENTEDAIICSEPSCGYDLFMVNAVEKTLPTPPIPQSVPQQALRNGRLCRNCNQLKPISMFVCDVCGANLSTSPIVSNQHVPRTSASQIIPSTAQTNSIAWELFSVDGQKLLTIREGDEKLIGWEHELSSYLNESFAYVGRAHEFVGVQANKAYIIDNDSKNGVQVNGQNITAKQRYTLQNGDHISLGDCANTHDRRAAHFIIRPIGG